jgi:hypothetical protein
MAVYVDDMALKTDVPDGNRVVRGRWHHLFADTHEELMQLARQIGLNPRWIQHAGEPGEHFDVVASKRAAAIRAGATPVSWRFAGEFMAGRRQEAMQRAAREACTLAGPCHQEGCSACYPEQQLDTQRRLLVTGPREGVTRETVAQALRPKFSLDVVLVAGGARGVDKHAASLWREWGGQAEEVTVTDAQWRADPKGAGFARNGVMVEQVKARGGEVLAIDLPCTKDCGRPQPHMTHGTAQRADLAAKAGLQVEHYPAPVAVSAPEKAAEPGAPGKYPEPVKRVRHAWGEQAGDQRECLRCGMTEQLHRLPTQAHPVKSYELDGRKVIASRVPECGQPLPQIIPGTDQVQLAAEADHQAGLAYRARDFDRAFRLLECARVLDPGNTDVARHHRQLRAAELASREAQPREPQPGRQLPAEPASPPAVQPQPARRCDTPECTHDGRPYAGGIRCDAHAPQPLVPGHEPGPLPQHRGGTCPGCGTADLTDGREKCQGCRALEIYRRQPQREPEMAS